MNLVAILVDELPDTCFKCMFRPSEMVGEMGNLVNTYCVILEKPMAEGARRLDCPLILAKPERKMPANIEKFIQDYEEGRDA